eukprot:6190163-Pleurochrysis_carterae.AAC.2
MSVLVRYKWPGRCAQCRGSALVDRIGRKNLGGDDGDGDGTTRTARDARGEQAREKTVDRNGRREDIV